MKRVTLFIVFCLFAGMLNAQTAKTGWDYPVKPGSDEWVAFSTHDEMLEVCQIPDEILKTATTEELVELCLNYPLRLDFFLRNSLQEGLERIPPYFNGLQELFNREDNASCLLGMLKGNDLDMVPVKILESTELGELLMKQTLAALFLSHKSVLNNASPEQQKEIARIAMINMTLRERLPEFSDMFHVEASAYLLCGSLKRVYNEIALSPNLEQFFNDGVLMNNTIVEELKQQYFQSLIK